MRALDQIIPALITAGLLAVGAHFMKKYAAEHSLADLAKLSVSITGGLLLIGWLLDRRAAAKKGRGSGDQPQP